MSFITYFFINCTNIGTLHQFLMYQCFAVIVKSIDLNNVNILFNKFFNTGLFKF